MKLRKVRKTQTIGVNAEIMKVSIDNFYFFWEKIDYVKKTSGRNIPFDLKKILEYQIPIFTESVLGGFKDKTSKSFKEEFHDKAGEATRLIFDGFIDWHIDVLTNEEEELSHHINTEEIIEKLKECNESREKAIKYANKDNYYSCINLLSKVEENLVSLEEKIKTKKRGIRGLKRKNKQEKILVGFGLILGFLSNVWVIRYVYLNFGILWSILPIILALMIVITFIRYIKN